MPQTKLQKAERAEAIEELRKIIKPGDTIYTILRHVSKSGMMRHISVLVMNEGEPFPITNRVALATDSRVEYGAHNAIKVAGVGMDMGFSLVYDLTWNLYPDGFDCIGPSLEGRGRCPSNDHSNIHTIEELETAQGVGVCKSYFEACSNILHGLETRRDGKCRPWHHSDGGYALKQAWL